MEKTFIIPTNFIDKTCGEADRPSQLFVYHLKSSAFWGPFLVIQQTPRTGMLPLLQWQWSETVWCVGGTDGSVGGVGL